MRGSLYSTSSRMGWSAELLAVFVSGFLLATILWLGLWSFWTRPAQAVALRAKEAALRAKETALLNCVAAKDQCNELRAKIQGENGEINVKLKEALLGWGRCIRGKNVPDAQEKPSPNPP
jgi:hypothetical protein